MPGFACVRPSVCAGMRVRYHLDQSLRVTMVSMLVSSGGDLSVLWLTHGECKESDDGKDDTL